MSLLREDLQNYTGASNLAFNEKIKNLKVNSSDHTGEKSPTPQPQHPFENKVMHREFFFTKRLYYLRIYYKLRLMINLLIIHSDS